AGLVLLWHWRAKFFRQAAGVFEPSSATTEGGGREPAAPCARGPLPFWVALSLYASMPLFNLHTFIALTVVLVFALFLERPSEIQFVVNTARKNGRAGIGRLISHPTMWPEISRGAPIRRHAVAMLAIALIPATFFVWLVTDHFRAASILQWHPGWAQDSSDLGAPFFRIGGAANFGSSTMFCSLLQKTWNGVIAPFFQFWLTNFGLWIPLALALVGLVGRRFLETWVGCGGRTPAHRCLFFSA